MAPRGLNRKTEESGVLTEPCQITSHSNRLHQQKLSIGLQLFSSQILSPYGLWEAGEKNKEGWRVGSFDKETDCVSTSADSGRRRNWCFCPTSVPLVTPLQFAGSGVWCAWLATQSYHSACWRLDLHFQSRHTLRLHVGQGLHVTICSHFQTCWIVSV